MELKLTRTIHHVESERNYSTTFFSNVSRYGIFFSTPFLSCSIAILSCLEAIWQAFLNRSTLIQDSLDLYSAVHHNQESFGYSGEGMVLLINEFQRVIIKAELETTSNNNERQYKRYKRQNGLQITFRNNKTFLNFKNSPHIKFAQSPWLRQYIELNTNFRTHAKNDFEKIYTNLWTTCTIYLLLTKTYQTWWKTKTMVW